MMSDAVDVDDMMEKSKLEVMFADDGKLNSNLIGEEKKNKLKRNDDNIKNRVHDTKATKEQCDCYPSVTSHH